MGDIRLVEPPAVDIHDAVSLRDDLAGQADDSLHERAALGACLNGPRRCVEDDDLAALRVAEAVDEAVGDDAVRMSGEAAVRGASAVERRLHRGGRDPVRVGDLHFHREDDDHRDGDRQRPVEDASPRFRDAAGQAIERISHSGPQ